MHLINQGLSTFEKNRFAKRKVSNCLNIIFVHNVKKITPYALFIMETTFLLHTIKITVYYNFYLLQKRFLTDNYTSPVNMKLSS